MFFLLENYFNYVTSEIIFNLNTQLFWVFHFFVRSFYIMPFEIWLKSNFESFYQYKNCLESFNSAMDRITLFVLWIFFPRTKDFSVDWPIWMNNQMNPNPEGIFWASFHHSKVLWNKVLKIEKSSNFNEHYLSKRNPKFSLSQIIRF